MASFEQNKNSKLWSVRFRVIEYGVEKQKRLSGFDTKKAANKAYVEYMATYVPNKKLDDPEELTMHEVYLLYMKDAELRLKPSTLYVISNDYNNFIAPVFANKNLKDITKRNIIDWQNSLTARGYAYKYKMKIRGFLSAIYSFAMKYLDFNVNIVSQCPSFAKPSEKKEMQIWSQEDFEQFIDSVDDIMYKAMFYTLYYTGLRKGEMFALHWSDINLKNKTLKVSKNLTRKSRGVPYEITTPKNLSSNRTILMPDVLVDILSVHRKTAKGNFVFGGDYPVAENTFTRYFKTHCKLSGVKEIRIHDFRHSHASLLISRGASIVMVAKRLGHSSTEQTLNTYAHLMPSEEYKLMELL